MTKRSKAIQLALELHKAARAFEKARREMGILSLKWIGSRGVQYFESPKEIRDLAKKDCKNS